MALLMFGTSPTPTAMFASCVIIRATKGRISHSEAEEACREPIPTGFTGRIHLPALRIIHVPFKL